MATAESYTLQTPAQLRQLLVSFRKRQKMSQAALAERLGISQQSYAQIEANPMATSVERLYRILRLLDVEVALMAAPSMAVAASERLGQAKAVPSAPAKVVPPVMSEKDRW